MERWPFVGRSDALAAVAGAVAGGYSIVVAGPAGSGKTRLVQELLRHGLPLPTVSCTASRATAEVPLAALATVLDDAPADAGPGALLSAARSALRTMAAPRVVIHVDDVQWLDEVSASLIAQLLDSGHATLLGTLRSGTPASEAVAALWRPGRCRRVDLEPLSAAEATELVEARLQAHVAPDAIARLTTRSGGNVLFLQQLVEGALAAGDLSEHDGIVELGALPLGQQVGELLGHRLDDLDDEGHEALALVCLGEPLELDLAIHVAGAHHLEALERRELIEVSVLQEREVVRPAHPLFADIVLGGLGRLQRRRLLGCLADALTRSGLRRRRDALRAGLWSLDAGRDVDPELLRDAATQARFVLDDATAERLARAAHDADPCFATAQVLVDVLYERGSFAEREEVLRPYVDDPDDEVRAITAMARAVGSFWGLADGDVADEVLAAAEAEVRDPAWWWEVRATRATLASQAGHPERALALLAEFPEPPPGPRAQAQAALAWAFALADTGHMEDAVAVIDRAMEARDDGEQHLTLYEVGLLVAARGMAMVGLGRLDDAQSIVEMVHGLTVQEGNQAGQGFFAAVLDWIALHRGDHATAMRRAREALRALRATAHVGPARWAAGGLLFAAALARDHDAVDEARRVLDDLGQHPAGLLETAIERARAWADVADGRLADACDRLRRAADDAAARGAIADELAALTDLAELGHPEPDRARALAARCDGELAPLRADHVAALAAGDAGALEDVASRYAGLGMQRAAASAAMAGSDVAARSGDLRSSRRLAQVALATTGDVPEAAIDLSTPTPLTRREREIASLAAEGLSSKAIAEQLFLSVRTVDNHLSRVYVKLGVGGRGELAAIDAVWSVSR